MDEGRKQTGREDERANFCEYYVSIILRKLYRIVIIFTFCYPSNTVVN